MINHKCCLAVFIFMSVLSIGMSIRQKNKNVDGNKMILKQKARLTGLFVKKCIEENPHDIDWKVHRILETLREIGLADTEETYEAYQLIVNGVGLE